ncbi:hypothetical protein ACLOJK_018498 [Asimina triloba]
MLRDARDAKIVVDWFRAGKCTLWYLWDFWDECIKEMRGMNVRFIHQFREGNLAADFLAKLGESGSNRIYEDLQDLPRLLRGIIRIDKTDLFQNLLLIWGGRGGLSGCVRAGWFEEAFESLRVMRGEGFRPNRLELICKVQGLEQAEKFFNNIPKQLKGMEAFGGLLYCYVHVKSVENAEGLFKKMKDLGYANSLSYNTLMNLYLQTKQYEKLDGVVKEMNENGISCNKFTYGMLMTKFVATSDIDQMEATLKRLEDDPKVIAAWEVYSIAADCYKKVGILDKAVKMLKKSEAVVPLKQQRVACDLLLSRYSGMGLKDDVYRLWNLQKSISKKVPNQLVVAYCKKGQFDKDVSFIKRAIEGGRMPYPSTWEYLATGYINSNQIPKGLEMMKKAMSLKKIWLEAEIR